jgi:hypothetical protein
MKTQILKTEEDAIRQAKVNCIRQLEKELRVTADDNMFINSDAIWLIKKTSTQCSCGETSAREVVLFAENITTELEEEPEVGFDLKKQQWYSTVGFCDVCGED